VVRIFPVLSLNLLQGNVRYFKEDDPLGAVIILVCLAAGAGFVLILNLVKNAIGSSGMKKGGETGTRQFSVFALYRIARYYRLNRAQTKILGEVFKSNEVADLSRVMEEPDLMDRCFRQTYKTIGRTVEDEKEAQQKIAQLFSLRNVLDVLQERENSVNSTTQVAEDTKAMQNTAQTRSPVQVVSSRVKTMARRKFRRKQIVIQCFYYSIRIEETKIRFKKIQKMIVSRKRITGIIMNISIGGCAMKASVPVPAGSRLKIEINYSRERGMAVIGQVLRINQSGSTGTVMHIKFLKVPRRTWNVINAVVFDYNDD
jgi:hypothetical protein